MCFNLRGYHPVSPAFPDCSDNTEFCNSVSEGSSDLRVPRPPLRNACRLHVKGLGWSGFARRYFRNHYCFLFLWVLRWFTSPRSRRIAMDSRYGNRCLHRLGSPIRKSPDQSLFAAPRGLSQLTTSFIAVICQGIHRQPLIT